MRRRLIIGVAAGSALLGSIAVAAPAPVQAKPPIYCVRECDDPGDDIRELVRDLTTCHTQGGACLPDLD